MAGPTTQQDRYQVVQERPHLLQRRLMKSLRRMGCEGMTDKLLK